MADPGSTPGSGGQRRVRIFESYGRGDTSELADRLFKDMDARGFDVFLDREAEALHGGAVWEKKVHEALSRSEAVIAILSPHAVREASPSGDSLASVCLDEIAFARYSKPPRPIVPVMAIACEPPWTLYRLEFIDMQGWEQSEARYQQALEQLLDAIELAKQGKQALRGFVLKLEPDEYLAAFLDDKRQKFTGRKWLFAEIERWRDTTNEPTLVITGDPGAGKSALVAELVHRNPGGQVVAYHCCLARLPESRSAGKFVRNIAAMLASQLPPYAQAIERGRALEALRDAETDPISAFARGVIGPLMQLDAPAGPPRYILIDGLDEALASDPRQTAVTIPELLGDELARFPHWLRLVVTSRRTEVVLKRFRPVRELRLDAHDERNMADVRAYLDHRLRDPDDLARVLGHAGLDADEALARLCALADGSFVYAKHAADTLKLSNLDIDELERRPPGLESLYGESFTRTFAEPGSWPPCAELLAVLRAARRGLRRSELEAVLGVTPHELADRLVPLEPYLALVDDGYAIFHKSLADWLTDASTDAREYRFDRRQGEPALLAWCRTWRTLEDDYPLHYLPAHLAAAGAVDELLALLADPEFRRRRRAAAITPLLDVEDYTALSSLLLEAGRTDEIARLATTTSPYQRDGIALTLRGAGQSRDQLVRATVDRLLNLGPRRGGDELPPELLNARMIAIETAAVRGYADALVVASNDRSPAVRALLVPHLYRFWKHHGEQGWALLDELGRQLPGRLGVPRQSQVEVSGGLSLAILTRDSEDQATIERLGAFWRGIVRKLIASPLARTVGKGLALKAVLAALSAVMRDQPEYQPLNLRELRHTFAGPAAHERPLAALRALEQPAAGLGCVVEALQERTLDFDVYLMMVAERALVLHGARDPGPTIAAIEQTYHQGCPWFRQSCLYSAFHTLNVDAAVDPSWLDLYGELTEDFFRADRARLQTAVGSYSFPPHLAWPELVFERHRPTGRSRFLSRFFGEAHGREDEALCRTVITACQLLSFAYRKPQLALDALRDIAPIVPAGSPLQEALVQALANIRLYEDASVDRFLRGLDDHELTSRVRALTPSVSAEEFPTWMDSFFNHQLVTSEDFRIECCGAFRRAADATNVRELLYDNVIWVLDMLAGERLLRTATKSN